MQALSVNKRTIYYATYIGMTDLIVDGYKTGEKVKTYSEPVAVRVNVSAARGSADSEQFGISTDYDRTIVTADKSLPIDETTVLWVGIEPTKPYNYIVVRRAESINSVTYAIREVSKS